jgi:hypothetical protein
MRQVGHVQNRIPELEVYGRHALDQLKLAPCPQEASDPVSYFHAAQEAFASATRRVGGHIDRHYRIAGYNVRLSFAGMSLRPSLCTALEHLRIEADTPPHLTISLWDTASTGVEMPPPAWSLSDYGARGEIAGYNNDRISTCFKHGSGGVSLLDNALDRAIFWVRDADQLPYWEKGAPLLNILHWWMGGHDRLLVHGAAVGTDQGAALIVGRSGSGKSTTALACLSSGLLYLGDDYTIIATHPSPVAHSLYATAKVDGNQVKAFPHLLPKISNSGELVREKALMFLSPYYSGQIIPELTVRAILVPKVTGMPMTRLKRTSAAAALSALAPSTIFQLPRAGESNFKTVAQFVSKLPCYTLECGTELAQIPEVVVSALSRKVIA